MNSSELVLIIEHQAEHVQQANLAFRKQGLNHTIRTLRSTEEALYYLKGIGVYQDRQLYPLPCLLLIDLNLPMDAGFELVAWVRGQPSLRYMLLVATDAAGSESRAQYAYDLGVNAFYSKPADFKEIAELIRDVEFIDERWKENRPNQHLL